MRILVGNLDSITTAEHLEGLFEPFGPIRSIKIVNNIYTGHSKGFGFVVMQEHADADNAIEKLNGSILLGKSLNVSEAYPRRQ